MLDFLSGIGDAVSSIASAIGAALAYILSVFVYLFNLLVQLLSAVAQAIAAILGKIGSFLQHLWSNFFKGILSSIWQHIRDAVSWLHDHLQRIIHFAQRVQARLQRYYNLFVVPYLRMIQRIRQYLHILALLHVHIAAELDAKLAQVQAQLVQSFATIRAALNAVIDIGNAIVDPAYLIRKPALVLSIRRQLPALIHLLTGRPAGYWFPSPRGSKAGAFAPASGAPLFAGGNWITAPSSFLGDDAGVPDVTAFADGLTLLDSSVDQSGPLDYFDDDLYPEPACTDPATCLASGLNALLTAGGNG